VRIFRSSDEAPLARRVKVHKSKLEPGKAVLGQIEGGLADQLGAVPAAMSTLHETFKFNVATF
jgi:hypothetical protein